MTGHTIEDLAVGDQATMTRTITPEAIREYLAASGDVNPIHSDAAFAAMTRFGQIIAPGMLTGGLVAAVIGTSLPGPGTVYLSQHLRFLRPVHIGDVITARAEVAEVVRERNRIRLKTVCVNQDGEAVLEGEAWVMPPRARIEYQSPRPARWNWDALTYAPAALAVQVMSCWIAGLALSTQALRLWQPRGLQPIEADSVRS